MSEDVTLQFNLSPGDVDYAALTVPALASAHRGAVQRRIAIVDLCRPQRTRIVDPERRFPPEVFAGRCQRIRGVAADLLREGVLDEVHYLEPGSLLLRHLSHRFTAGWITETHDYGGCALMAYFAALELPSTPWVLHYDADMLLHQAPGFDWVAVAQLRLAGNPAWIAATPRISPPWAGPGRPDGSCREGRLPSYPVEGGWLDSWFSTRCFLMDLRRLNDHLPLIRGRLLLETLGTKYLRGGYPRSPEIMLYRGVGFGGGWRLTLSDRRAWLLHPASKPKRYLELLPGIMRAVAEGTVPLRQRGVPDVDLEAWEEQAGAAGRGAGPPGPPGPRRSNLRSVLRAAAERALWGWPPRPAARQAT